MATINFEYEFKRLHPDRAFLLNYMHKALDKEEIVWDDLTAINLMSIATHIKSCVTPNSASIYFSILKSFLNLMSDEVELPTMKFSTILKCKKTPQQNVALTEDEVQRIDKYYQKLMRSKKKYVEKDVLTLFLIECYCGARGVDVEQMTVYNIKEGRLTYVSQKTNTLATMPVHYRLRRLLQHRPKKEYSRQTKNKIVKRVCKKCGIDEEVTIFYHGKMATRKKYEYCGFHTARRSFASMLATKGVPVVEISQYMSHRNISMTEKYIKVDRNHVSEAALAFFSK